MSCSMEDCHCSHSDDRCIRGRRLLDRNGKQGATDGGRKTKMSAREEIQRKTETANRIVIMGDRFRDGATRPVRIPVKVRVLRAQYRQSDAQWKHSEHQYETVVIAWLTAN